MIHTSTGLTAKLVVGETEIQTLPIEVDGRQYPLFPEDQINPPESERFEIVAVRIKINNEWTGLKLSDEGYEKLEEQILESI